MIFDHLIKENRDAFIKKVIEVSDYLGVKPEHLMFLMWFETGHTLDHRIQNKIGATAADTTYWSSPVVFDSSLNMIYETNLAKYYFGSGDNGLNYGQPTIGFSLGDLQSSDSAAYILATNWGNWKSIKIAAFNPTYSNTIEISGSASGILINYNETNDILLNESGIIINVGDPDDVLTLQFGGSGPKLFNFHDTICGYASGSDTLRIYPPR